MFSQGRDGFIKIWDAERLVRDGRRSDPGRVTTPGVETGVTTAEPCRKLTTRAFHFCQFALTRWREAAQGLHADGDEVPGILAARGQGRIETRPRAGAGDEGKALGGRDENHDSRGPHETGHPGGGKITSACGESEGEDNKEDVGLSTGSFATNMLLAPCHEQHAVSPPTYSTLFAIRASPSSVVVSRAYHHLAVSVCLPRHSCRRRLKQTMRMGTSMVIPFRHMLSPYACEQVSLWDVRADSPAYTFAPVDPDRKGDVCLDLPLPVKKMSRDVEAFYGCPVGASDGF